MIVPFLDSVRIRKEAESQLDRHDLSDPETQTLPATFDSQPRIILAIAGVAVRTKRRRHSNPF